jgi:hypothetical protein
MGALLALAMTPAATAAQPSDLDALMGRVLERRNETWRVLHDYVLDERERFALVGPSDVRLFGSDREYTWYVRDGYLVRSPVRFDGVTIDDARRRAYEVRWLEDEKNRQTLKLERARRAGGAGSPALVEGSQAGDAAALVAKGVEPRFVSEAYFLRFTFEPGNYYLAGREALDGRPVLRIEYYPTRLFSDRPRDTADGPPDTPTTKSDERGREERFERELDRKMNKVSLVTIWVDPAEEQIVKYTFDNLGMDFMPGQWLVRVGEVSASMTMGQYFGKVWLPKSLTVKGSVDLAIGTFDASYAREFLDYRQAETKARIREYQVK